MANKIVPQTLNSSGAYDKLITAISSGGTGAESESAAVKNLISGLTSTSPASDDLIPFQDVSSGGAGKTTLSALASTLQSVQGFAKIQTGSYVGTGTYGADNPCSLTFDFTPNYFQLLSQVNNGDKSGFSFGLEHYVDEWQRGWYKGNGIQVPIINTEYMDTEYNIEFRLGILRYNETTYKSNIKYMKTTNTLFWYNRQSANYQYNTGGTIYYWIVF